MLETLDSIDWANIHHLDSTAEEFPKWIRQLRSKDPEVRKLARENIFGYNPHPGNIFPVTPYLIPFVIELVAAPDTEDKTILLHQLAWVAEGSLGMARVSRSGGDEETAYKNVEAGMDVYLALLDDPAAEVRLAAYRVVTALQNSVKFWKRNTKRLLEAVVREQDAEALAQMIDMLWPYVHTNMIWGLRGDNEGQATLDFIASLLTPERAPRVRLHAALGYMALMGGTQRETAGVIATILRDALVDTETYSQDRTTLWIELELKHVLEGLAYLPRSRRLEIIAKALPAAQFADDAHLIGYSLLETLFFGTVRTHDDHLRQRQPYLRRRVLTESDPAERPDNSRASFRKDADGSGGQLRNIGWFYIASPPPADLSTLSSEDRRLLRLVLDTDLVWMLHSNLLAVYGLPVERAEARALLDEADAANAAESGKR